MPKLNRCAIGTITAYTDVFNAQESSPILGYTQGKMNQQRVGQDHRLYV